MKNEFQQAHSAIEMSKKTDPNANHAGILGYLYAKSGEIQKAEALVEKLQQDALQKNIPPGEIAIIFVGLGKKDAAFHWLNRAFDQNSKLWLSEIKVNPMFDPIRTEPEYTVLLRRMSLN
jgi:hypothetical protein